MNLALALVLVALGGTVTAQRAARAEFIGPLFALDSNGALVASARLSAEGDYRLVVRSSPTARSSRQKAVALSSALEHASPEHGLWVRWRIDIEHTVARGLELRIEDAHGTTIWRRDTTGSLPEDWWTERVSRGACAGGSVLVAHFPAQPPPDTWARVFAGLADCTVVIGDAAALERGDLQAAREHFVEQFRGVESIRPWGVRQMLHLPATDGATLNDEPASAVRRAWAECSPLGDAPHEATHRRLGELNLFLVDRTGIVERDALAATIGRLAASNATFKLIVREGRWFDSRENARDAAEWNHFVQQLSEKRVTGVVLIGSDPRSAYVVEHPTRTRLGYDLLEVVCGPSTAVLADAASQADPKRMRGSAMTAAFVHVGLRDLNGIAITLQPQAGGAPFMVERTSSWLRPR